MADAPDTAPKAPPPPRADARCPHCDHPFEPTEVTEEWCAACGRKIPEILLKDIRPKPHLRHPMPVPEPTKEERAELNRVSRTGAVGMLLIVLALLAGVGCFVWGAIEKLNGGSITPVIWVAAPVAFALVVGLFMFATGRTNT